MIKINLTPIEELENPYWWAPDAAVLAVIVVLTFGGLYSYVSTVEESIQQRAMEKQRLIDETTALNADVNKFDDLNNKIAALQSKKSALQQITESKLIRYLPIILLENIQNLKPDGVWLNSLAFVDRNAQAQGNATAQPGNAPPPPGSPGGENPGDTANNQAPAGTAPAAAGPNLFTDYRQADFPVVIEITGSARDNIRIAEFMMALKATQTQSFEKSDLRTQIFFSDVGIGFSQIVTKQETPSPDRLNNQQPTSKLEYVQFKLQLSFRERGESGDTNAKFSQFIDDFRRTGQAVMH